MMDMTRESIEAQIRNPLHAFSNRVRFINYGRCYYFEPFTMREFRRVDPKVPALPSLSCSVICSPSIFPCLLIPVLAFSPPGSISATPSVPPAFLCPPCDLILTPSTPILLQVHAAMAQLTCSLLLAGCV